MSEPIPDADPEFCALRRKLGADALAGTGGRLGLTDEESEAILLSVLADGKTVPEADMNLVLKKAAEAKVLWSTIQAAMKGLVNIFVDKKKICFHLSDLGKKIAAQKHGGGIVKPEPPA